MNQVSDAAVADPRLIGRLALLLGINAIAWVAACALLVFASQSRDPLPLLGVIAVGAASVAELRIVSVSRRLGLGATVRDQQRLAYGSAGRDLLRSIGKGWVQLLQWGKLTVAVLALVILGARLLS